MIELLQEVWTHIQNFDLHTLLLHYGYYAILLITFLEGESIVILAGVMASQGLLDPVFVALCAFAGSTISDQTMFSLGKYKGAAMLKRFPSLNKNVDRVGSLIKKYDIFIILGFRFVYGVRNITPIMLGIWGESHLKFLCLNIIGALAWAASFTAIGFYGTRSFLKIKECIGDKALYIIAGIIILALLVFFIRRSILNKKKAREEKAKNACETTTKKHESLQDK